MNHRAGYCAHFTSRVGVWQLFLAAGLFGLASLSAAADTLDNRLSTQINFDIPAQALGASLKQLADQAGIQILFEEQVVSGLMAPGVKAHETPLQALNALLKGTALEFAARAGTIAVRRRSGAPTSRTYRDGSTEGQTLSLAQAGTAATPPLSGNGTSSSLSEPASRSEETPSKLEEIVVTAQKRVENLQQVPISAQVVGGQTLVEQNYNSLEELTETVSGVHIKTGDLSNNLSIRGVSSGDSPSFDQSVAMFTDDIYHGRSRMSGETFLDLDRIEVLKGPQSTFFGNNAIAGALNVVTKQPGDSVDASARLLYGQFGQYAAEGAIGGPITDMFGARLAVTRTGEKGWITDVVDGQLAPDLNNEAARVTLLIKPTEDFAATFKMEGSDDRTSHTASTLPTQRAYCPAPAPLPPSYAAFGTCPTALSLGLPEGLDNNEDAALPGQQNHLSTFEDVLTLNYHAWGQTFTSVTGFYNYHFSSQADDNNLPTDGIGTQEFPEKYRQFSQELRVASPSGQSIEYLAGMYYQSDQLDWDSEFNVPLLNFLGGVPAFAPYIPIAQAIDSSQGERVYSVFGSLMWNATDSLKFGGGLRASRVQKDFAGVDYGTGTEVYGGFVPLPASQGALNSELGSFLGTPPGSSPNLSCSDHALMPSGNVEYSLTPQSMVYFSYSKGFKAGGFNAQTPDLGAQNIEFGPERVNAYELGIKSKWLDDTLLMNLDVFRSDYKDLQVESNVYHPELNTYTFQTGNAADSLSQGVELETQWVVSRELRFKADVTYLDAYYVSYPNARLTNLQSFCAGDYVVPNCSIYPNPVPSSSNLSGQRLPYAPRFSGSLTADYSVLVPGGFKFTTELSPYATTSFNRDPNFNVGNNGYMRLDARLSLATPDNRWAIDLIGKNLTDRVIIETAGIGLESKQQPRNVAVQFRYRL